MCVCVCVCVWRVCVYTYRGQDDVMGVMSMSIWRTTLTNGSPWIHVY